MSDTTPTIQSPSRAARRHALERAYPLAKQLSEILELEAIEPAATTVKRIRQRIGAELAEIVATEPAVVPQRPPCRIIGASPFDRDQGAICLDHDRRVRECAAEVDDGR